MKKIIAFLLVAVILVSTFATAFAMEACPHCPGHFIVKRTYGNWFDGMMRVDKNIFGLITGILWAKYRNVNLICTSGKTHTYSEVQPGSTWYATY